MYYSTGARVIAIWLTRRLSGQIKPRDRDDIIRNLIEAGQVAQQADPTVTKTATLYLFIGG
tara:strand:- start:316 stop:498 length:183 start_codon:yes stop_codon:yes gene_type:complete